MFLSLLFKYSSSSSRSNISTVTTVVGVLRLLDIYEPLRLTMRFLKRCVFRKHCCVTNVVKTLVANEGSRGTRPERRVEEHKVSHIHQLCDVLKDQWKRIQGSPVELWWTPRPRGLRQWWRIMAAHRILTLWTQFGHFHLGVYSLLVPVVKTLKAVLSYFEGQYISTVIQAVHWLPYIVSKCHFFSVVLWIDLIK